MVEPGKQGTTQETPRVFTRGMLEYILFRFFYDDAETQPVQPLDNTAYPSYRILDPSGAILAQGVGVSSGQPGFWKIGWVVPRSAPITDNFRRYQFNSTMVDAQLRQFETSFEFDVVEGAIPAQQAFEQQFMSFTGVPIRLILSNTLRPVQLSVAFFLRGQDSNPLYVGHFVYPLPVPLPATNIMEVADNAGGFNYYIDVPGQVAGSYSAVWALRDTAVSQLDIEHQSVQVVNTTTMHRITSLRMLFDKLQKKLGLVFSYTNSDILEYLNRGGELVNSYWPPTNWNVTTMPTPMEAFYILAGAWWGLTAQRILYAETQISFSGQTVTLDYNPGADIDNAISQFKEVLDNQVSKAKKQLLREARPVGTVATRPYRFRTNLVFPVSGNIGQALFMRLSNLGLTDWLS